MNSTFLIHGSLLPTRPRTGPKAKDLYKDYTLKAKAKTDTYKAKDLKIVLKDRSRPRTYITVELSATSGSAPGFHPVLTSQLYLPFDH